jgi:NAD(P)-dependent dehydrogenase (short-subunit alcohol dehydrogenase family)
VKPTSFTGRRALVTGGGSGIGAALCARLAERGAIVVAADIDVARVTETCKHLASARPMALDVCDAAAFAALVAEVEATDGPIDYLFNNAGILRMGEVRDIPLQTWRTVIETNLFGVVNGIAAMYPLMVTRRSGHIVNMASASALLPSPLYAPYAASKAAIVALSTALRLEAKVLGVRVSVVCPGNVDTPIFDVSEVASVGGNAVPRNGALKKISPESAANAIIDGVERNSACIVFPLSVRAMWSIVRLRPTALDGVFLNVVRRFRLSRKDEKGDF